jgi:hypothetical protein
VADDDILTRAREALDGVSEGPWEVHSTRGGTYVTRPDLLGVAREWSLIWQPADARFIAAARTLVPELVAEVERLRGYVAHLEREGTERAVELAEAEAERDRLAAWKAEALQVLTAWEQAWEASGRPGALGTSKAAAVREHMQALRDEVDRLRAFADAVLGLHHMDVACGNPQHTNFDVGCPDCAAVCDSCGEDWPCRTADLAAERGVSARQDAAAARSGTGTGEDGRTVASGPENGAGEGVRVRVHPSQANTPSPCYPAYGVRCEVAEHWRTEIHPNVCGDRVDGITGEIGPCVRGAGHAGAHDDGAGCEWTRTVLP